jgi:hypothetical protein
MEWNIIFRSCESLSVISGGEQGLLSMTFHPSYDGTTNRDFFITTAVLMVLLLLPAIELIHQIQTLSTRQAELF